MRLPTPDEPRQVLQRLVAFVSKTDKVRFHQAGPVYTSLMICFLLHSKGAAETLLAIHEKWGNEWFPSTACYQIVRSMFELDVTAHYISQEPTVRAKQYIEFEHVINKKMMDAVERHRSSANTSWNEGMNLSWTHKWAPREATINAKYRSVLSLFPEERGRPASSWSGKSIYQMAREVDHVEAYDVFYSDLSAFAHVNVQLANRFLKLDADGAFWSQRANERDVGMVFRYAAIFLTCFLEHFGDEMGVWSKEEVVACWDFEP